MRENRNPRPEPTPEQQQKTTSDELRQQYHAVDALETMKPFPGTLGLAENMGSLFGRTNFAGRELNSMLDLLETANPSDLEHVGRALARARDSLNDAARELDDHLKKTDWEGESGREFRRYGSELTKHAWEVASFANVASTQISVAGTGLASVSNSTSKQRDTRPFPKRPEDFTPVEQTENHGAYKEAVEVERNRQQTINQMNRLASFYAVSEQTLASQKAPVPPKPVRAAVPKPSGSDGASPGTSGAVKASATGSTAPISPDDGGSGESSEGPSHAVAPGSHPSVPAPGTSVQIDTVAPPVAPAPTPNPAPAPAPTAPSPTGPSHGPLLPPTSLGTPPPKATQRPIGTGNGTTKTNPPNGRAVGRPGQPSTTATPTGRTGPSRNTPAATGRPAPVGRPSVQGSKPPVTGRPTTVGRPSVTGRGPSTTGRLGTGPTSQSPITGRPSATQPTRGRAGTGMPTGPRSGRTDNTVGGTPQRAGTGPTSGSTRTPRGGVIGSQPTAPSRGSTGRPGQSGVVGSQPAAGSPRPTGRGGPAANGVVGTPRSTAAGSRPGAGSFTSGGAGLAGGRPNQQRPRAEERDRGGERPDYLTEDEETWEARRRNTAPPVID